MVVWDPTRYLQFADVRARPFLDLIAQIPTNPLSVIDLGCGPGHLTKHLRARWPSAEILGIDREGDVANCSVTEYRYDPTKGRDGGLVLVRYNETAPVEESSVSVTSEPDRNAGVRG